MSDIESENVSLKGERTIMRVRTAISAVTASALLAGTLLLGSSTGALAAGPGDWDYIPTNPEFVTGTPEGVKVWMNNCYVSRVEPTPGMFDGKVTHPGRYYGCNMGIEVSERYEQEHGQYTVSAEAIGVTQTFQALGAPYIGVGGHIPCEPGVAPHYLGIASAGEAGTYGSEMGGFHMHFFDVACFPVNEFPPDPEPPAEPEPEPEEPVVTPEPEPEEPVVTPEPEPEGPVVTPEPEPTPTEPPAVVREPTLVEEPETVTPRAVPETVQTGAGPATVSALVSTSALTGAREPTDPTIRELLQLLCAAKIDVAPTLTLPESKPMPFNNVLEPTTFDDLWVVDDAAHGYTADGPQYFLAHTHTQGGAIGNAVNEASLTPGAVIEVAGVRYDVTGVETVAKSDIGALPMWQASDPDDAFLVVCLWNNGVRATHNLVIELHRS
ncbi:hypothetical protein [Microbacterium sp.]|uniref:hypothetical protein n=1 Tax=Microbacterium sp. TaxID=51671 RepID=UPI003D7003D6